MKTTINHFRCKLTICDCQEPRAPGKQPGRHMHARNSTGGKDGEKEQRILLRLEIRANPSRTTLVKF